MTTLARERLPSSTTVGERLVELFVGERLVELFG